MLPDQGSDQREDDMAPYEVVDHFQLVDVHVIERSRYIGRVSQFADIHAPDLVRNLEPGERAYISGSDRLDPFTVVDGLWVNGTWIRGWAKGTTDPGKHNGEIVQRCFEGVDPVEVTQCQRRDGKWIVHLGDGGVCTGSTALYLVIVK
jgi:hypothetical protein